MDRIETRDDERVAESVRRALALVGPAERGYERMSEGEDEAA